MKKNGPWVAALIGIGAASVLLLCFIALRKAKRRREEERRAQMEVVSERNGYEVGEHDDGVPVGGGDGVAVSGGQEDSEWKEEQVVGMRMVDIPLH
jgi:hypothetical protein